MEEESYPINAQAQVKTAPHAAPHGADDSAKRRQIIQGARAIFLAQGFDAASMSDIARAAGVSKGTLYVYFDNKERCSRPSSAPNAWSTRRACLISIPTIATSKPC